MLHSADGVAVRLKISLRCVMRCLYCINVAPCLLVVVRCWCCGEALVLCYGACVLRSPEILSSIPHIDSACHIITQDIRAHIIKIQHNISQQSNEIQHNKQTNAAEHIATQHNKQTNAAQHIATQHKTSQHNTVEYNISRHNKPQHTTAQDGLRE